MPLVAGSGSSTMTRAGVRIVAVCRARSICRMMALWDADKGEPIHRQNPWV